MQLAIRQPNLKAAAEAVYNGSSDEVIADIFNTYNSNYHSGIKGLDDEQAKMFKNNMSRLAAVKTNNVVQQLQQAKASAISKEAYNKQAEHIINKFNSYQAVEYNTAVHRTRVAKQWAMFQKEKHLYPNLMWLRTRSAKERPEHLRYAGRVWPMNDPFWDTNQPGCLYECKCSWKTTDAEPTDNSNVIIAEASAGLEGNPYYTNELFTEKHPYYAKPEPHIANLGPLMNSDKIAYIGQKTAEGNSYLVHYNCIYDDKIEKAKLEAKGKKSDTLSQTPYDKNIKIAQILANNGMNVKLLPKIHASEVALRERYFGKEYNADFKFKEPDAMVDGNVMEFKKTVIKNLAHNLKKASDQSNIAVINLDENLDPVWLKRVCMKQFGRPESSNLVKIIITNQNNVFIYDKN